MTDTGLEESLGAALGIPGFRLPDNEAVGIRHAATGATLDLQADSDRRLLHVCALAGAVPVEGLAGLYRELLARNGDPRGPCDPALAFDRDTRQVALSVSLPLEGLYAGAVLGAIDAVAGAVEGTRDRVAGARG
jgi:hypothetical protein